MNTRIDSVAIVGKSITVKVEKDEKKDEHRICHLKVERIQIDRATIDAILGRVEGWASRCLFDEAGSPVAWLTLSLDGAAFDFTGSISGNENTGERLSLGANCRISNVTLELRSFGALLSGELSWPAAGDELSDVDPLLGKVCAVRASIIKPDSLDLFEPRRAVAGRNQLAANHVEANARLETSLVEKFRRTTRPLSDAERAKLAAGDSVERTIGNGDTVTLTRVETAG
jgi:hypothetical protein